MVFRFVSRAGGQGSGVVTVVFNDITGRKRTEANLAFLAEFSEDLVRLTDIDETMNFLGQKIAGYFSSRLTSGAAVQATSTAILTISRVTLNSLAQNSRA